MKHYPGQSFEEGLLNKMSRQQSIEGEYFTSNHEFDEQFVGPWNNQRIRMGRFTKDKPGGIYDKEDIIKDMELVKKIESRENFILERGPQAVSAETMILEGIYNDMWFGDDAMVAPASKYDDIVNGIDCVISFNGEKPGDNFYLGVDTTSSMEKTVVDAKVNKGINQLNQETPKDFTNKLFTVKYFEDPDTLEKKSIKIPRIVLGIEAIETEDLMGEFIGEAKKTSEHPIQMDLLEQAISQLSASLEYILSTEISETFKINGDNWIEFIQNNDTEINKKPGLRQLIDSHTKPLAKLSKIFTKKKESLGPAKGSTKMSPMSALYNKHAA